MKTNEELIIQIKAVIKTCEEEKPSIKDDLICESAAYHTIKKILGGNDNGEGI